MTFDEWWQPTEEYINTTTEYDRQRNTWKAALRHAAEVAEDISAYDRVSWGADTANRIAARLRQEANNGQ